MCLGITILGCRSSHIEVSLAIPVEGIVESFVAAELWPKIIDHTVGLILQG